MKTIFSLHHVLFALFISFVVISCDKENLISPENIKTELPDVGSKDGASFFEVIKSEELPVVMPVTKEMEDKVIEVVKPVKEIVEKLLNEDQSGTYTSYKKDVEIFASLKDPKEKTEFIAKIQDTYFEFFTEIWKKADIDEEAYQQKIRDIFPNEIKETILFTEFLNFSMDVKKHTKDLHDPAPPPQPAPEYICYDARFGLFGITHEERSVFAGAGALANSQYLSAYTVAVAAGLGKATATWASNITIPGTFPDDDKLLRVTKRFFWDYRMTAVSIIGCSFVSVYYSTLINEEYIRLWAPVTWISTKDFREYKTENYLIEKKWLYNIRFGVMVYSDSFAEIAAGSTADADSYNLQWSVCEE